MVHGVSGRNLGMNSKEICFTMKNFEVVSSSFKKCSGTMIIYMHLGCSITVQKVSVQCLITSVLVAVECLKYLSRRPFLEYSITMHIQWPNPKIGTPKAPTRYLPIPNPAYRGSGGKKVGIQHP